MKAIVIVALLVASAAAQRPTYAGSSPKGVPDLAARFRPEGEDPATVQFANRVGVVDGTTEKIPIDARGDVALVNRIKDWPEENRPFWYVNADAIERHRGTPVQNTRNNQNQGVSTSNNQGVTGQPAQNNGVGVQSRFSDGVRPDSSNTQSFNVVSNNQWKTYVYDPSTDAWYPKTN